jgi:hypothetical protein
MTDSLTRPDPVRATGRTPRRAGGRPLLVAQAVRALERERRAASRLRDLNALLRSRPDLRGVHRPADVAAEAVAWSA